MSDEATLRISLQINKGNLVYQSQPVGYTADVGGTKGPTPGAITVTPYGTDVNLSQLTLAGLCRIMNIDDTNWVEVGVWDPETLRFYPLVELLPGETYVVRLARNLHHEYGTGTGTGTLTGPTNRLRIRSDAASCNVIVEAFEA